MPKAQCMVTVAIEDLVMLPSILTDCDEGRGAVFYYFTMLSALLGSAVTRFLEPLVCRCPVGNGSEWVTVTILVDSGVFGTVDCIVEYESPDAAEYRDTFLREVRQYTYME